MLDLDISLLRLNIDNAQGHEHRVQSIALRATEILTARLESVPDAATTPCSKPTASVNLNLANTSNEQAAQAIASAWLQALSLRLEA